MQASTEEENQGVGVSADQELGSSSLLLIQTTCARCKNFTGSVEAGR